ncbi:cupin domain-containing protein [Streptomyces sp. YIM 98790]|uniref:cupin domain-containing protein n=1 Tax=Streptomyces sp. YIM 98790 TaxID=2689077 RepID=UPI00140D6EB0|nr:cupin domain-containing protein [Streptomyces sp. YIM 98790]
MAEDPGSSAEHVRVEDLLRGIAADRSGALWRLTGAERQLDANVVRLPPGGSVADHAEPELDVLVAVLAGRGVLRHGGAERDLLPGAVHLVPRGTVRGVRAGPEGLVWLTVHRRRPGLSVRGLRRAPGRGAAGPEPEEGGEPACLLSRVCPGCGAVIEMRAAAYCPRCGEQLPSA